MKKNVCNLELESPNLSRRDFGKIIASLGIASVVPGIAEAVEKENEAQKLRERLMSKNPNSAIQIDKSVFKRYDSTEYAFTAFTDKHNGPFFISISKQQYKNTTSGKTHKDIDVGSVALARSCQALHHGATAVESILGFTENKEYQSWNAVKVSNTWYKRKPDETDIDVLTAQAKLAARLYGADLVGMAELDRNFVYSHIAKNRFKFRKDINRKEINFKDIEYPEENEKELIIPNSVNNAIVMGIGNSRELLQTAPSAMTHASGSIGYTRQSVATLSLCEYIRSLGYVAIPCSNTTVLQTPMGIAAGLGQAGRLGTLITPEFGPNLKVFTVLTNMPVRHDKPIDFGVTEFCETCKKCARECPSKTITEGPRSYTARTKCSQDGVLKWQNDYMKCLEYWVEGGTNCSLCLSVCPYTKGAAWIHDVIGVTIDKLRFLDPVMLGLDDAFGYGKRRDEKDVWNMTASTYGMDLKRLEKIKHKGKFPL